VRDGNTALAEGDATTTRGALASVLMMTGLLGINPVEWAESDASDLRGTVDALVSVALEQRAAARARKDYAASDAIRDQLSAAGVVVEDTAAGPRWTIKGSK